MKKVCLAKKDAEDINFLIRGQRHGAKANEVVINAEGILVTDEDAAMIEDRLGMQVTISNADAKDVAKQVGGSDDVIPEPSDAVKKLAADNEIDLATITGTGAKKNIVKADVEAAIKAKAEKED